MWREVVGVNGSYELREPITSYEDDFGPENVDLRPENAFYRDISFWKTITWPGPTQCRYDYLERSTSLRSLESSRGAGSQERLTWLDEAWLSSIKTSPKCKVQIFHYVPHVIMGIGEIISKQDHKHN